MVRNRPVLNEVLEVNEMVLVLLLDVHLSSTSYVYCETQYIMRTSTKTKESTSYG